jgi:hypothetical protein
MQWCLWCECVKPNTAFRADRASCRACLAGFRRAPSPYEPYIKYARQQWKNNTGDAEAIAWTEIDQAQRTFDPSRGMTLDAYTRLRIHNAIANERRKLKHFVPWSKLGLDMQRPGKGKRTEIRIDAAIAQPTPDPEPIHAQWGVRWWLLWSEVFGEPLTFESAKAHFGQNDPTVGCPKRFVDVMKKLGFDSRWVKRDGELVTIWPVSR